MKRIEIKSVITGLLIGILGLTSVIAADQGITATRTQIQVHINEEQLTFTDALVTGENEDDAKQLYLSANEVFEYLGYDADWQIDADSIELTDKTTKAPLCIEINATDELPPNGYIILGQYTLSQGDTVQYHITAQGHGVLQVGFIEPEANPHTASLRIFQQSNYNQSGNSAIMDSDDNKRIVTKEMEGMYSLFICNTGDKPLTNMNGTIRINQ